MSASAHAAAQSFKHSNKYSATASKYGEGGVPTGAPKPVGVWDGFRPGQTAVDRKLAGGGGGADVGGDGGGGGGGGGGMGGGGGGGGDEKEALLRGELKSELENEARKKSAALWATVTQVS